MAGANEKSLLPAEAHLFILKRQSYFQSLFKIKLTRDDFQYKFSWISLYLLFHQ